MDMLVRTHQHHHLCVSLFHQEDSLTVFHSGAEMDLVEELVSVVVGTELGMVMEMAMEPGLASG